MFDGALSCQRTFANLKRVFGEVGVDKERGQGTLVQLHACIVAVVGWRLALYSTAIIAVFLKEVGKRQKLQLIVTRAVSVF